jgi:hypothetical protein
MGLIKTAIMTGGGLYAVNKIVKTAEHRHENRQQAPLQSQGSRSQQDYPQQQGYWGPPPPGYHQDRQQYIASSEQEQPQYFNQPQQQGQGQSSYYQPSGNRGQLEFDYVGPAGAQQQSYTLRNQQPRGFVREMSDEETFEQPRGRSSSSRGFSPDQLGSMMKMATDFIGSRK